LPCSDWDILAQQTWCGSRTKGATKGQGLKPASLSPFRNRWCSVQQALRTNTSKPPKQPINILQLHRRAFAFRAATAEFLLQLMRPQAFRFARHQSIAGIILR
jgi:hypothetical protein